VGRSGSGSLTLPDVTGAVEPPLAFAMPAIAPLEDVAASDRSAGHPSAPSTASASELPEPAEPPRDYLRAAQQLPLDAVVPRTGPQRDPQIPFSSAESVSQWGRRGTAIDPHQPIVTSSGPAGRAASLSPGSLSAVPGTSGSSAPGNWAPPDSQPIPRPAMPTAGALNLSPASPSALMGERPAQPGNKSLGALCRGLGWGLVIAIVAGALTSWLSVPALAAGWYFAWRHPVARRPLLRAYGVATAMVLIVSLLGSPTRSGWEQLSWASWMANIGLLVAAMIIIDRTLTPPPRDDVDGPGQTPQGPPASQGPQTPQTTRGPRR
jgi:hypothetical protein